MEYIVDENYNPRYIAVFCSDDRDRTLFTKLRAKWNPKNSAWEFSKCKRNLDSFKDLLESLSGKKIYKPGHYHELFPGRKRTRSSNLEQKNKEAEEYEKAQNSQ